MKDSLKLLPSSLRELCMQYKVPTQKGVLPYYFYNPERFEYVGSLPEYKYWLSSDISVEEDSILASLWKNGWDAKNILLKYLKDDLISLHQVISLAQKEFFLEFKVDIVKCLTLPGVGWKIYRSPNYYQGKDLIKHLLQRSTHYYEIHILED